MLDFFHICTKEPRREGQPVEVYPDFIVGRSRDLMVQGQSFYAIWDEEKGLWSRDEYDVQRLVDAEVIKRAEELKEAGTPCTAKLLRSNSSNGWNSYKKYIKNSSDNSQPLDTKVTFLNTPVKKTDYASRRLTYNLEPGDIPAYEELVSKLYTPEERAKFEWAIGSIIAGDSKRIQKFLVFYGAPGTGKSTILDIAMAILGGKVEDGGYVSTFVAKDLVGNNPFAMEAFKANPLLAIQHDGDLSKIEDNSKLNSIVSHEDMRVNEKYKATYDTKINAILFMGTNKPVRITDSKSGLIRRLIDVHPTGDKHDVERYFQLMSQVEFEYGAIAHHCYTVYKEMGRTYYNGYEPRDMMLQTDVFFNYIEDHFDIFKLQDAVSLKQAWELYKNWAEDSELGYKMQRHRFREELKNYFDEFHERLEINGTTTRSVYRGFSSSQFKTPVEGTKKDEPKVYTLVLEETRSLLDDMYAGMTAQYAKGDGNPRYYWDDSERYDKNGNLFKPKPSEVVSTVLGDLNTQRLHFLKLPQHHIVIDFDLKGDDGEKSLEANLKAASAWPATYAELSKSGKGVHLHYFYDGDTSELAPEYSEGIEIKVYRGNSSLRRKLSKCNNVAVATIKGGLPFREKKMLDTNTIKSEQGLRNMIIRNLRKEIHPGTKPSIDFIGHLLKEAKKEGYPFDLTDLRPKVMAFANNSSNQAAYCLKAVARMDFKSEGVTEEEMAKQPEPEPQDTRIVFFDCEVYPNLFVVCWKYHGSKTVVRMINPDSVEMEQLVKLKLVGYNNRGYDNHIIYARMLGASNEDLYKLSQKIIVEKDNNALFGAAWGLSYADVYDFISEKKSLKKWEIELGLKHMEMDIPWDQPVPPEKIEKVVEYCCNDVNALEAVFDHRQADFQARVLLAEMSGLPINTSTRQHTIRIMFGAERAPQKDFVYTDLSDIFPGYEFDEFSKNEKSKYKGEIVGEGGYVYAEPGIYENVGLLDIASMHPTSIIELNLFGKYTANFQRLVDARLAIKHGDISLAEQLLPGVQVTPENAKALSDALKLVINSIYGYTAAKFPNPFRDPRNKDNIVAKRGALFMVELKNALQEQGIQVIHIKTDSVKIPNITPDIIAFVQEFGAKYGYTFEHEATYEKICLVNDAVYVASVWKNDGANGWREWTATGAEFKHPVVFKSLFSGEPLTFRDLCETKQVQKGAMYLRYPEADIPVAVQSGADLDTHIGRSGLFVPISPDQDYIQGGKLVCWREDLGKDFAVPGTKGYLWAEAEMVRTLQDGAIERMKFENIADAVQGTGSIADIIDFAYYTQLVEDAWQSISEFGDAEAFCQ